MHCSIPLLVGRTEDPLIQVASVYCVQYSICTSSVLCIALKEGCAAPADYDQGTRAALRVKRDRLIHLSELGNVGLLGVGNSEVRPRAQQAAQATTSNEIVWVSSSKLYTYQHIVFFIHRN